MFNWKQQPYRIYNSDIIQSIIAIRRFIVRYRKPSEVKRFSQLQILYRLKFSRCVNKITDRPPDLSKVQTLRRPIGLFGMYVCVFLFFFTVMSICFMRLGMVRKPLVDIDVESHVFSVLVYYLFFASNIRMYFFINPRPTSDRLVIKDNRILLARRTL